MGLLRFALAICVFFWHSSSFGLPILRGDTAVEVFFVISGFYMQLILDNVYTPARLGKDWLKNFYINRYLRLLPVYIITAVASLAFAGGYLFINAGHLLPPLQALDAVSSLQNSLQNMALKLFLLTTNITMLFQDVTVFIGIKQGTAQFVTDFTNSQIQVWKALAVPQAWSIGTELSFYLISPFLLRLSTRKLLTAAAISLGAKAIFLVLFGNYFDLSIQFGIDKITNISSLWGYRFFPFEISYFLSGAIAFRYYASTASKFSRPTLIKRLAAYFFIILSVTISSVIFNKPGLCWIFPLGFAASTPILFHLFGNSTSDRAIGELSYPFYITHILCIRVIRFTSPLQHLEIPALTTISALLLTLGCSAALIKGNKYIEEIRLKIRST